MKYTRQIFWWISVFATGACLNLAFQNCASGFKNSEQSMELALTHPEVPESPSSPTILSVTESKIQLGDRDFLQSFYKDAFLTDKSTADETNYFNAVFYQEVAPVQHLFGRSCNPEEQGSATDCYFIENNQKNSFYASSSSGREASRFQICSRVLANDTMLGRMMTKLPERTSTPDAGSLDAAISIFYPDMADIGELKSELANLDKAAAYNRETTADRWRMVFLSLCESPGWQVFSN